MDDENESQVLELSLNPENTTRKDENNNKCDPKYYHILKFSIVNLIGFGCPLNECLESKDKLRIFFNKFSKILIAYQIYCFFVIHSSLILNMCTIYLILEYVWINQEFTQDMSTPFILSFMHILAVFAFDIMFYYRRVNLFSKFVEEICDENYIIDSSENKQNSCYLKVYKILQKLRCRALAVGSNYFWIILFTSFLLPIFCHCYMIFMLYMSYFAKEINLVLVFKYNIIFFPFSTIFITFTIIQYILSCLLMILKFVGLNNFIQKLIDDKTNINKIEDLEKIIKW
jgi:hypothetical protein